MRREERHHLKENPVAVFVARAEERLAGSGRAIGGLVVVVVLVLVGAGGYYVWHAQQTDHAGMVLGEALSLLNREVVTRPADAGDEWEQPENSFPSDAARLEAALPALLSVADAYPTMAAGITARFEAAAALVRLDRIDEAATQYEQVVAADVEGIYGAMARLGLAETRVLQGEYDAAIALLEPEADALEPAAPVDAILMRIGRAYELAGQEADAVSAFNRVVEEFPFSVYYTQAREKLDALEPSGSTTPSTDG